MNILRFDTIDIIESELNHIEDILNFFMMLRSSGFTSDLLKEKHGFSDSKEIKKVCKLIGLHIDNAVSLAQQGLESSPESSFLPLYYSTLNLAKVHLLMLGKRIELENNRWHGANYDEKQMHKNFLNEEIVLHVNGSIPLLYKNTLGKSFQRKYKISLGEIYANISTISAEYKIITKKSSNIVYYGADIIQDDINGHFLRVTILDPVYSTNPISPRKLQAFKGIRTTNNPTIYETAKIRGNFADIRNQLSAKIRRNLNSHHTYSGASDIELNGLTPIGGREHVLNEEFSIMLAYFHLSNVIRYNPEHLYRLMDSKYWALILGLRKHGFLRFQKLMWGNFNKSVFDIT